jgi:hypothetical protein
MSGSGPNFSVSSETQSLRVTAVDVQTPVPQEFDWVVYADATAAGLAVLIPIPILDWTLEQYFRRRMSGVIARRNGRRITPAIRRALNKSAGGFWPGCLMWPVQLALYLLKNIYRTLVYILSIKDATDNLSYYWHRAFLIDYMARRGDLDQLARAEIGGRAMNQVLGSITTSPLTGLAQKIVQRGRVTIRQALRVLFRWRWRQEEPAPITRSREELAARWTALYDYFAGIARRYDEAYASIERAQATNQV